uniref:Uncharacterized protein n=1 Tax=Onchocerca volvulus TaxID=6282 RepID=A0A8R1TRJ8_ONCVO
MRESSVLRKIGWLAKLLMVHRRNVEPLSSSVSSILDVSEAKRNFLRRQNSFFAQKTETKSEPMMAITDNSENIFRTSLPTSKRTKTLEEIIELARRKSSHGCEEPSSQKHYVTADDDKLPVEEPAMLASEIMKDNKGTNDEWAYLEQLMEFDEDRISPSGEPPSIIDNDDDT